MYKRAFLTEELLLRSDFVATIDNPKIFFGRSPHLSSHRNCFKTIDFRAAKEGQVDTKPATQNSLNFGSTTVIPDRDSFGLRETKLVDYRCRRRHSTGHPLSFVMLCIFQFPLPRFIEQTILRQLQTSYLSLPTIVFFFRKRARE